LLQKSPALTGRAFLWGGRDAADSTGPLPAQLAPLAGTRRVGAGKAPEFA